MLMINTDLLLAYGATYRNYRKGDYIFHEGMDPIFYHQLVFGKIKMISEVSSGKSCILDYMQAGEALGLIAIMLEEKYVMTAVAEDDCLVARVEKHIFKAVLKEHPETAQGLLMQLTRQLKFKSLLVKELHDHSSVNRVKTFIEYVMGEKKFICPSTKRLLLTRQQIADLTGLRVETVIRAIRYLQKQSLLQISKGKIYASA